MIPAVFAALTTLTFLTGLGFLLFQDIRGTWIHRRSPRRALKCHAEPAHRAHENADDTGRTGADIASGR